MYLVYILKAKDGRIYVGMTSRSIEMRLRGGYKNCPLMNIAIKQNGMQFFTHEIVAEGLTEIEASALEQKLIEKYDSTNPILGFNTAYGGRKFQHNERTKCKMSISMTPRSENFKWQHYDAQEPYKHGVKQLSADGEFISEYASIREAGKATKTDPSNIRKCAQGMLQTTNHYKWQFI